MRRLFRSPTYDWISLEPLLCFERAQLDDALTRCYTSLPAERSPLLKWGSMLRNRLQCASPQLDVPAGLDVGVVLPQSRAYGVNAVLQSRVCVWDDEYGTNTSISPKRKAAPAEMLYCHQLG